MISFSLELNYLNVARGEGSVLTRNDFLMHQQLLFEELLLRKQQRESQRDGNRQTMKKYEIVSVYYSMFSSSYSFLTNSFFAIILMENFDSLSKLYLNFIIPRIRHFSSESFFFFLKIELKYWSFMPDKNCNFFILRVRTTVHKSFDKVASKYQNDEMNTQ